MSDRDEIYGFQPLWGKWYIELPIGKGSFGSVYKISREDMGRKYTSAVKFITVPSEEQRKEAEASLGSDEDTLTGYFEDIVKNIVSEIDMLYTLGGNTNIISYQDHEVRKKAQGIGWDILIRMEYVTSLRKYLKEHAMTREEAIRLGVDICTALETCSKKGIVHRDIKDENIFVSEDGVFKLGDFGIARELSKSGRAASMRGTPLYMAPEIYRGEKYDAAVDIYSLGIMLYKLLNNGRMPFMPPYPEKVKYQDSEDALEKRMSGATLPPPAMAGGALAGIVLKACAYSAMERYASPTEMKRALESALAGMSAAERAQVVLAPAERAAEKVEAEERVDNAAEQQEPTEGIGGTLGMFPEGMNTAAQAKAERLSSTVGIFTDGQAQGGAEMPKPINMQTMGINDGAAQQQQHAPSGKLNQIIQNNIGLYMTKIILSALIFIMLWVELSDRVPVWFILGVGVIWLVALTGAVSSKWKPKTGNMMVIVTTMVFGAAFIFIMIATHFWMNMYDYLIVHEDFSELDYFAPYIILPLLGIALFAVTIADIVKHKRRKASKDNIGGSGKPKNKWYRQPLLYIELTLAVLIIVSMIIPKIPHTETVTLDESPYDSNEVILFSDPNLEAAVREQLGISEGNITAGDAAVVTALSLAEKSISSIGALKYFINLAYLDLGFNNIEDISVLSGLKNLSSLMLWSNQIKDISALSGLNNLKDLYLSGNLISDISSLSGLKNIDNLQLAGNEITDIKALSELTKITLLTLAANQINDISDIAKLTNLTQLWINDNQISDISILARFKKLYNLGLSENNISDISSLSGINGLYELRAENNQISDISALSGLDYLQFLSLNGNKISDINSLSGLVSLSWLDLQDNDIADITPLSGLTNLNHLYLSNNHIIDFSSLTGIYDQLRDKDFDLN